MTGNDFDFLTDIKYHFGGCFCSSSVVFPPLVLKDNIEIFKIEI